MLSLFCTNPTKWEDPGLKTKNDSLVKKLKTIRRVSLMQSFWVFSPYIAKYPYDEKLSLSV